MKNPGFPVPPIFYENVHFFSIIFNLALCVILKTKLSSSRTWFIAYFKTLRLFLANCLNIKWMQKRICLNSHPLRIHNNLCSGAVIYVQNARISKPGFPGFEFENPGSKIHVKIRVFRFRFQPGFHP